MCSKQVAVNKWQGHFPVNYYVANENNLQRDSANMEIIQWNLPELPQQGRSPLNVAFTDSRSSSRGALALESLYGVDELIIILFLFTSPLLKVAAARPYSHLDPWPTGDGEDNNRLYSGTDISHRGGSAKPVLLI